MDHEEEWWSPATPHYQQGRTVELINLFQKELINARAALGESRIGYKYADGTTLKIFWETPEYLEDDAADSENDVVYRLAGNDFWIECRKADPSISEDQLLYDHIWGEIIEDHLWIDSVDGDDRARAWLNDPPERFVIDADTYRGLVRK